MQPDRRAFHRLSAALAALLLPAFPLAALAADGPAVVRIVVPFGAGNPLDTSARVLAQSLSQVTQRQFIVDNKPGAGGLIGTAEVARARPDGSVLLFTTGGHTTNAVLYNKLPYDTLADFTPITQIHKADGFVLLVRADSPYKSVADVLQAARAKPGSVSYGSWGTGNTTHLVGELFSRSANVSLLHVPYKGSPLTDFLGGHVQLTFLGTSLAQPLLQEGKVRALAITNPHRVASLPEVPTLEELGIRNVDVPAWSGLLGPAGMPAAMADGLQKDLASAVKLPDYQASMKIQGVTPVISTPAQFAAYIRSEVQRYRQQLAPLHISLD
ncbi:tripartite tricarboxylate transporter substrate binding protein [Variovorax paradoxus]|uniref:Bug family tripartite tricarboxylate transporter substrate binding protein n=1 Tax=Variovorax paradoxus TaxID=34073 RepID=UPI001ABCFA53